MIRGHRVDHARLVRVVQALELAVSFHGGVIVLLKDGAVLVMHLVGRSVSFGGRLDLRGTTNPQIHRKSHHDIRCKLMEVNFKVL